MKLIKVIVALIIVVPILLITLRIIFKNIYEHNSGRLMNISIECNKEANVDTTKLAEVFINGVTIK